MGEMTLIEGGTLLDVEPASGPARGRDTCARERGLEVRARPTWWLRPSALPEALRPDWETEKFMTGWRADGSGDTSSQANVGTPLQCRMAEIGRVSNVILSHARCCVEKIAIRKARPKSHVMKLACRWVAWRRGSPACCAMPTKEMLNGPP